MGKRMIIIETNILINKSVFKQFFCFCLIITYYYHAFVLFYFLYFVFFFVSSYLFVDTLYLSHRFVRFLIYIFIILFLMFLYYVLLCCFVMWIMCSPSYLILHLYTHRMFLCAIEK